MPEWIDCNLPWQDYEKRNSFTDRELNQPGTLIEVEEDGEKKILLIGDINTLSGVCDDCREFPSSAIIIRYAIVWKNEQNGTEE